MNFSSWAIRNPVPPILAFILMTMMGMMGFNRLDIQSFPDMSLPTVSVKASLDGAAAPQLESEVARKIEDSLTSLPGLETITTTITDGNVDLTVAFVIGTDSQTALNDVKSAVDQVQPQLPSEMDSPQVSKSELNPAPLVSFVVSSDFMDLSEISWFLDNDLSRTLMNVEGVGEVARLGGVDREIHVELDAELMEGLGLTADAVNQSLNAVQRDLSGGRGRIGTEQQSIRVLSAVDTVEELRAIPIALSNGGWVRLDEIANIIDTHADVSSLSYLNGEPVVSAQVKRLKGYSDTEVTEAVREAAEALAHANPGVTIEEAYNTIVPTEENYAASMAMLYEGALIAVLVVFLFLWDWRATVLAATALPLSIIPTFYVMDVMGYSLNIVTLLAMSLVVGILVDDAIVEVENIERHLNMGKKPFDAAMEGANEIGLAVIATTLTLVAVFLPTATMSGVPGLIFRQFGVTASVAVVCSLLVARLLTPMMAAYMMKANPKHIERPDGFLMRSYMRMVRASLRHRWMPVAGVIGFLVFTGVMITQLTSGFLPASDNCQTQVKITAAPGSTIEQTDAAARAVSEILAGAEHVTSVYQVTDSSGGGGDGPDTGGATASVTSATIVVDLTPLADRSVRQAEIEGDLALALQDVPGVRIDLGDGGDGTQLELTLTGDNAELLEQAAADLETELRSLTGIGSVTSSSALQSPEVTIVPDLPLAASLGVSSRAIADAVRVATAGAYSTSLAQLNLPERQVPIRVKLAESNSHTLEQISLIPVIGGAGNVILGAIAEIGLGSSPSAIDRLDRKRNITLTVKLNGRDLSEVEGEASQLSAYQNLPNGVEFVVQGESKRQAELFGSFIMAMAIGIFCVYGVLVLLFGDFLQPITILMALPLSLGGALTPLVLTGTSFSMPVLIGLLLLMGIVCKNSILLVEYAIMQRNEGMNRLDALVDACHKRARPIIMTTVAMAGGMTPILLGWIEGDPSFRQPMAIVVVGGLLTSTALSLVVIPMVYTFVDDLSNLLKRLAGLGKMT